MPGLWLVLPTYNEAENLEPLVDAALVQLALCAPEHRVLIVDDASPDGTGRIADRLATDRQQVEVLHRPGRAGLGHAYEDGFRRALADGAELVMQMDADFSHSPTDIPRLLHAATEADVAVGSRYVPKGEIAGWSKLRRLVSKVGCTYARAVLRVPVRDLTSGFKCLRREVLEEVSLSDLRTDGYAFQIETTYRALVAGFRVREVAICFYERRAGRSKMNAAIAFEAVWKVPVLRHRLGRAQPRTYLGAD